MTFVQRFGSSINLNPHFHVLFLDGVYVPAAEGGAPVFVAAPPLADEDVQKLVETASQRIVRLLQRRGLLDDSLVDDLSESEPLQAALSAASVQGQFATGECGGGCRLQLRGCVARRCASPLVVFRCMRPSAWPPTTGPAWSGSSATLHGRLWPLAACRSSTTNS